jgi:hypothetical protein
MHNARRARKPDALPTVAPAPLRASGSMAADAEIRTAAMVIDLDARRKPQTFNGDLAALPDALQPLTKRNRWIV